MDHTVAYSIGNMVRITGMPWVDMILAGIISTFVMGIAPHVFTKLQEFSQMFWDHVYEVLIHNSSTTKHCESIFKHSVSIIAEASEESTMMPGDEADAKMLQSPDMLAKRHFLIILGVLHELQDHLSLIKDHETSNYFNKNKNDMYTHLQLSAGKTQREMLLNSVVSFLPASVIIHQGMSFQFNVLVGNRKDEADKLNTQNNNNNNKHDKTKLKGHISQMSLVVKGSSLPEIKDFLKQCLAKEVDMLYPPPPPKQNENDKKFQRWLFEMINNHDDIFGRKVTYGFRASQLDINKTWRTVFFPEKQMLQQTVDEFESKTGHWHPDRERANKLIILLEGVPGCGKSSIIKAICSSTKRHLFVCNLSYVKNDDDLNELFRMERIMWTQDRRILNLEDVPMKKRIYVIEDLDCSGENSSWMFKRETTDKDNENKSLKVPPQIIINKSINTDTNESVTTVLPKPQRPTLSGLLNLFDGVIELQGSIIILTTNHVDLFDPALLRSGRMDVRISFTYIQEKELFEMLHYIFLPEQLTDAQCVSLRAVVNTKKRTASDIQQHCQECKTINDAVQKFLL